MALMDIRGYPLIHGGFQTWVLVRIWGRGWGPIPCTRLTSLTLLVVHGRYLPLHGLYLRHPLLLIPLVALIQLHVPPVNLLKLPLH